VTKIYFQQHASLRFVSLFNVEAALTAQMSPASAVRPTGIFPVSRRASPPLMEPAFDVQQLLSYSTPPRALASGVPIQGA